jgi:hypothetical protein
LGKETGLWAGWSGFDSQQRKVLSLLLKGVQNGCAPPHFLRNGQQRLLLQGCVKCVTHFWLVLRVRMNGTVILLCSTSSCCTQRPFWLPSTINVIIREHTTVST